MTTELTCRSCTHSRHQLGEKRLYCTKNQGPCVRRCPSFVREPGADEAEYQQK